MAQRTFSPVTDWSLPLVSKFTWMPVSVAVRSFTMAPVNTCTPRFFMIIARF